MNILVEFWRSRRNKCFGLNERARNVRFMQIPNQLMVRRISQDFHSLRQHQMVQLLTFQFCHFWGKYIFLQGNGVLNRFHTEHSLLLLCSSTINHYNILKTVQEFSSVDTFWANIGIMFPLFLPQKRQELGSLCPAFCFQIFSMQLEAEISFNMLW